MELTNSMSDIFSDYQIVDNLIEEEEVEKAYRYFISIPKDSFNDEALNRLYRFKITSLQKNLITSKQMKDDFRYFFLPLLVILRTCNVSLD